VTCHRATLAEAIPWRRRPQVLHRGGSRALSAKASGQSDDLARDWTRQIQTI